MRMVMILVLWTLGPLLIEGRLGRMVEEGVMVLVVRIGGRKTVGHANAGRRALAPERLTWSS